MTGYGYTNNFDKKKLEVILNFLCYKYIEY